MIVINSTTPAIGPIIHSCSEVKAAALLPLGGVLVVVEIVVVMELEISLGGIKIRSEYPVEEKRTC